MKLVRIVAALLALCSPAAAQWQTPNFSVPIGRGAGIGFKSAAPGTAGFPLISNGASADPTFQAISNASFGNVPANSFKCNPTAGAAPLQDCTITTAAATWLGTPSSANLRAAVTDETGTGLLYFQNGALGTPASGTLTNATGLPIDGGTINTLPVARGGTGVTSFTANCVVIGGSPVGCVIGSAGNIGLALVSNGTSAPNYQQIALGAISGWATGIQTWLGTPSSANLRAALTDETGTGLAYFQGGDIGTPSAGVATNLTALNATQLTTGTLPAARTNGHMNGTATNDNAAAGEVGEYVTATQASAQALTTNTPLTITSVSLTAGDWDVTCTMPFSFAASTTLQSVVASTSLTTNTLGSAIAGQLNSFNFGSGSTLTPGGGFTVSCPVSRYSLSATTTVYAVAQSGFGVSTATATAFIRARRVR